MLGIRRRPRAKIYFDSPGVRFLYDQNLSPHLVATLGGLYPGSIHVRDVGLQSANDETIWNYAIENLLTIVSKDADFHQLSFLYGHPPKVIWVRRGNSSTTDISDLLNNNSEDIIDFLNATELAFMAIG